MHIIKLNATDSTNTYLKNLIQRKKVHDFTSVLAYEQLKGRGQRDTPWESEPGKNLTCSILKRFAAFPVARAFELNICISLALLNALKQFGVPNLRIKWPNDILSGNKKICGILIENVMSGQHINTSVLGIGLNVNQTEFHTVSNVTSMKLLSGVGFNLDEVHLLITEELSKIFALLVKKNFQIPRDTYKNVLFRKDEPSTFRHHNGELFTGLIRDVSVEGKLCVEIEEGVLSEFGFKEIKLLY